MYYIALYLFRAFRDFIGGNPHFYSFQLYVYNFLAKITLSAFVSENACTYLTVKAKKTKTTS